MPGPATEQALIVLRRGEESCWGLGAGKRTIEGGAAGGGRRRSEEEGGLAKPNGDEEERVEFMACWGFSEED